MLLRELAVLPKPIYEFKPYFYLLLGSWCLLFYSGWVIVSGMVLYTLGAWLWILRSDYRRVNHRQPLEAIQRHYWSDLVYELLPFGYIFTALVLAGRYPTAGVMLSASLLFIAGVMVLRMRSQKRKQPLELHAKARRSGNYLNLDPVVGSADKPAQLIPVVESKIETPKADRSNCDRCLINDICDQVELDLRSVQEVMRLSQTVEPDQAFELYQRAIERIEGRHYPREELMPILNRLFSHSDLCLTWRKTGRMADL